MNILDYIDWRGDLSFTLSPFNEVDNLIFSELAYLDMDGVLSADDDLTLAEVNDRYIAAGHDQSYLINDPKPLLTKAAGSVRFRDVRVRWYTKKVDTEEQIQFAAMTFLVGDGLAYIGFSGTDNTIVGWREDCNFSFLSETPGQVEAAKYVDRIAGLTEGDLIVGGHSKGGNFAVYGAAFCDEAVRESMIIKVYSNDGPGFNDKVAASKEYLSILDKTEKIIPESSLVGILLSSKEERTVVKSDAKGVLQHDLYSWRVLGTRFEIADERSGASIFMDDTLGRWIASLSNENKQVLVNTVFDALEASGATTLSEINENKWTAYNAILKAIVEIDPESRNSVLSTLKKLFLTGRDVAAEERQKSIERMSRQKNGGQKA